MAALLSLTRTASTDPTMTQSFPLPRCRLALAAIITGCTLAPALAQQAATEPADAVCQIGPVATPEVDWHGLARYRAKAIVKDGRVVNIEVVALTRDVERRAQRRLITSFTDQLLQARCAPGDHVIEREFSFDLRAAPASAPASAG